MGSFWAAFGIEEFCIGNWWTRKSRTVSVSWVSTSKKAVDMASLIYPLSAQPETPSPSSSSHLLRPFKFCSSWDIHTAGFFEDSPTTSLLSQVHEFPVINSRSSVSLSSAGSTPQRNPSVPAHEYSLSSRPFSRPHFSFSSSKLA